MLRSFIDWGSLFMNEGYRRVCATPPLFNIPTDWYPKYDMSPDTLSMTYTFPLVCGANVFQVQLNFQGQIDPTMFSHGRS